MIEPHEITGLAKAVAGVIREYVANAYTRFMSEVDIKIEQQIKNLPKPEKGERGEKGANGERGEKGEHGLRGEQGSPGPVGPKGDNGPAGTCGDKGDIGHDGAKGVDGRDGKDGKDARDGRDGKDGAPGRDVLEIEILPSIDETKAYPRGTFAQHQGGLWRAIRNTEPGDYGPLAWAVIVEGIHDIHVEPHEDLRSFEITVVKSSGKFENFKFSLPVVLDRGVFKDGNEYAKGDGVSYSGSFWICSTETTKAKPGMSPDWRLSVKRGSDGKDGKMIEPTPSKPIVIGGNGQK